MAFKVNKGTKSSVLIQPQNNQGQTQLALDTNMSAEIANINVEHLFKNALKESDDDYSSETAEALRNKHVSKAFLDLYKKGVNPIRAEVLFVNEFVPLSTGEESDTGDEATINLNYGEASNLQVNQVMRLIDLQRVIRKTVLKVSADLLSEFVGVSNSNQEMMINHFHQRFSDNITEFNKFGTNTEGMIDLLIELALSPQKSKKLKLRPLVVPDTLIDLAKKTRSLNTANLVKFTPITVIPQKNPNSTTGKTIVGKTIASNVFDSVTTGNITKKNNPAVGGTRFFTIEQVIRHALKGERASFVRHLARYVILNYVTQKSIAFITRIYDLKDLLREAISIAHTELPDAETHESPTSSAGSSAGSSMYLVTANTLGLTAGQMMGIKGMNPVVSGLFGDKNSSSFKGDRDRIEAGSLLVKKYGLPSGKTADGFSAIDRHHLVDIINANVSADKTEEMFGSNRHMYLSLFANLLNAATFMNTLGGDKGGKHSNIDKTNVKFGQPSKNLAEGIKYLKHFNLKGMASSYSPIRQSGGGQHVLNSSNIKKMLAAVDDDKDFAIAELIAAVSYDQAAGANIYGGSANLQAPEVFQNLPKIEAGNDLLVDYFNKLFFDTGKKNWQDLTRTTSFTYENYAKNERKLGTFFDSRFKPREDDGSIYVPSEHTYDDNQFRDDVFVTSNDYFFSKAVESENLKFTEMVKHADETTREIDAIVHDISAMLGLDFNTDGGADVGNLNLYENSTNPMEYFRSMCDALGKEVARHQGALRYTGFMSTPILKAGSFEDMQFVADTMKAHFYGAMISETMIPYITPGELENEDGSYYDENLIKPKKAAEEAQELFAYEAKAFQEEKVWYPIWRYDLKSLLKKGKSKYLSDTDEHIYHAQDKKKKHKSRFKSLIWNKRIYYGIGNLRNEKDDDGNEVYKSKSFGAAGGTTAHPQSDTKTMNQGETDDDLGKYLNIDTKADGWAVVAAVVGLVVFGLGVMAVGTLAFIAAAIGTGLVWSAPIVIASIAVAGVGGVSAAVGAILGRNETVSKGSGVSYTSQGRFEPFLLLNGAILPSEALDVDDEEEMQKAFVKTAYGAFPDDVFFIKAALWNTKDDYRKYAFKFNGGAGKYGGIFKTTAINRWVLFNLFFYRMYYKCLRVKWKSGNKKLRVYTYASGWAGMADALQNKGYSSDYTEDGVYARFADYYSYSYYTAKEMISDVTNSIYERRSYILRNLLYLKQNSKEIREAVGRAEAILQGRGTEVSPGEKIALQYLRKVGFAKQGMSFLNDSTAGILLQNYQKNYLLDFKSDKGDSPDGFSVFPFFKKERYDIRDLKLMTKVFSEKGSGLTSHKDDNLGRKTIFHIGIPNGMMRALRNEAYNKTNEIEYYYSDNIVIHITKINDLDPTIKYQSRSYVFNMAKYVAPFKTGTDYKQVTPPGEFTLGNHLENYRDDWSITDIQNNVELMTAARKEVLYGEGLSGIKLFAEGSESEYGDEIYREMLKNHLYDYFSKLYTESTTGINISEINFPLDANLIYTGEVDEPAAIDYEKLSDELIQRFPAANLDKALAEFYYRVMKTSRNAAYFSAESRYEACLSTQCFERVLSIPISERDFMLKQKSYNLEPADIYKSNLIPKLTLSSGKVVSFSAVLDFTGKDETLSMELGEPPPGAIPQNEIVSEYKKTIDAKKTDVASYIVEVALLKSSKRS